MPILIIKRILSLILLLSIFSSLLLSTVSCMKNDTTDGDTENAGKDESEGNGDTVPEDPNWRDRIVMPEYREYDRLTVNFSEISYKRPDFDAVISAFRTLIETIEKNEIPYEDQLIAIEDLEDEYTDIRTMNAFANIYNSKDSSVEYWNEEYSYVTKNYPSFAEVIEDLFVAAANSPHAESFEKDYFGEGLIEEYKDGGKFTDTMIELWAREEELEAEYSSLSTATVEVTYLNKTGTVDEILDEYLEKYGESSEDYMRAKAFCMQEYEKKTAKRSGEILVLLFKTRKLIANELGNESYIDYAYESMGRDYTPEDMSAFLDEVREYVIPIFAVLDYYVFYNYFQNTSLENKSLDFTVNTTYDILHDIDIELYDIYGYMLQFGLFDIEKEATNRAPGAFTTYLDAYEAPFIFMSATGSVEDMTTLFHEFGHFAENYINFGSTSSLDKQEISSQGLEMLMLHYAKDKLTEKELQYLTYYQMSSALNVLAYQSFYAKFEEIAYAIPFEEITKERLDRAVVEAAEFFSFNTEYINSVDAVFIPHIFLYPFYVQSYCTSIIPSLEIYFLEGKESGAGLEAYKRIIDSTEGDADFVDALIAAGLSSPFEEGVPRDIADSIYYEIVGSHYYTDKNDQNAA